MSFLRYLTFEMNRLTPGTGGARRESARRWSAILRRLTFVTLVSAFSRYDVFGAPVDYTCHAWPLWMILSKQRDSVLNY
jgi:hypothetical protein